MKNTSIKKMILKGLGVACGACLLLGAWSFSVDKTYTFADAELASVYDLGEVVEFPDVKVSDGEKQYDTETVLYYPDGTVKQTRAAKLTVSGEYTLEYRAFVGGKTLKETYTFKAYAPLYETTSTAVTAIYKTDDSAYNTGLQGLDVSLPDGVSFQYNKPINLYELGNKPIIEMTMFPKKQGTRDINAVTVTLTDVYDPNNTVIVFMGTADPGNYAPYQGSSFRQGATMYFVGTSAVELYAYRRTADSYLSPEDMKRYGFESSFSFSALSSDNKSEPVSYIGKEFLTFSMDLENKQIYAPLSRGQGGGISLVTDLSNDSVYSNAWEGFTTGEVYVTITCGEYDSNNAAHLFITKIGEEDLTQTHFEGGTLPKIYFDTEAYEEDALPDGTVNKTYPVFTATAYDYYNGGRTILPRVFFNYKSSTRVEYPVSNGKFLPDREGEYTFVYEVDDSCGHKVEKTLTIEVTNADSSITSILPSQITTETLAGKPFEVVKPQFWGGSGDIQETVTAICNGVSYPVENYTFVPKQIGTYTIRYNYVDYIGNEKMLEYDVQVANNPNPVAESEIQLPKYLIEGRKIELPDCTFVSYNAMPSKTVDYKLSVIDGDGRHDLTKNVYTVKADAEGYVTFIYSAQSDSGVGYLPEIKVPVRNVMSGEMLDFTKYFIADDTVTMTVEEINMEFSATDDGKVSFVNPIIAEYFTTTMKIIPEQNQFGALKFYFKDSIDEEICLELELRHHSDANESIKTYLNGIAIAKTPLATFINGKPLTVTYSSGELGFGKNLMFKPKYDVNGNRFNDFPSGKIDFSFEFFDVYGESKVELSKINNQNFNNIMTSDITGPELIANGVFTLVQPLNTEITIYDVFVSDMLDTYTISNVSVRQGKEYVTATDGTLLKQAPNKEYKIKLAVYGTYNITYTAFDGAGNSTQLIKNIVVYDLTPPNIEVSGEMQTSARVGDTIKLPDASATDNVSQNVEVEIYVVDPNYRTVAYERGMEYERYGTYVIRFVAFDEEGNMAVYDYRVKVS